MMNRFFSRTTLCVVEIVSAIAVIVSVGQSRAAIPPFERILPADTLFVFSIPDMDRFGDIKKNAPQARFWDDPAMKPFKDKFASKWNSELVGPLERELGIRFSDYTSLPHGQVTFAVTKGTGSDNAGPGLVFLVDTKDKNSQLKTNLANLRTKWVDAGKSLKTEKLHGVDFMELPISSDEMPKTLKKFFSAPETESESTPSDENKPKTEKGQIVIGQFESLLIIGNTPQAADSIATRLTGGSAPILADVDSFSADKASVLRDAPLVTWANVRGFVDFVISNAKAQSDDELPMSLSAMFKPEKVISAIGLNELKSVALAYRGTSEGIQTDIFLRAPESARQGILKILTIEGRESGPPAFVPADVVKFQRWRLDGQKAWATLEKMLSDVSATAINTLKFAIESANAGARVKDPDFDLRKQLFGNLGNDFINYQKAPRDTTLAALRSPPSIFLIGSPNTAQFVNALQAVFRLTSSGGVTDREFLGRKIYTVTIPGNPVGGLPEPGQPFMRQLHYAANSSYVAISADVSMVEEFLRSGENPPKSLRETSGLMDAAQKVSGSGTGWFGYENQNESMRVSLEAMRKNAGSTNSASSDPFFAAFSGIPGLGNTLRTWVDFSLLPSFDKVSKYFYFTVFAGNSSGDGITFKVFAPTPPGLR